MPRKRKEEVTIEPNYRFPRCMFLPLARRAVDDELLRLTALIHTLLA